MCTLRRLGGTVLHGVDVTQMKFHQHLKMRKFDRIIFNFPNAGFSQKEDSLCMIKLHQNLVREFFSNASKMLGEGGEIHVSHKTNVPYSNWKIEELAASCLLEMVACVAFKKGDYPEYNNKRGSGQICDQPFPLGKCSTYKFVIKDTRKEKCGKLQEMVSNAQSKLQVCNAPVAEDENTSHKFSMEGPLNDKLIPNKISLPTQNEPDDSVLESKKNQQVRHVPILLGEESSSKMATIKPYRENVIKSRRGLFAPREPNEQMHESTRQKRYKYGVGDPSLIPASDILDSVNNQLLRTRQMRKRSYDELSQPPSFDYSSGITSSPEILQRRGYELFHSLGSRFKSGNERWMGEEENRASFKHRRLF